MLHEKQLINKIFAVTTAIQKESPVLYDHLTETPLFLSYNEKEIRLLDFEQYLESVTMQLKVFEKNNFASPDVGIM